MTDQPSRFLFGGGSPESLYRENADPWSQTSLTTRGSGSLVNAVITDVIARYAPNSILDIGCGLGVRSGIYFGAQREAVGGGLTLELTPQPPQYQKRGELIQILTSLLWNFKTLVGC